LYAEAVRLATRRSDKSRIKQKLNLELGIYWLSRDRRLAVRHLEKANEKNGIPQLTRQAKKLMARIQ
jgi:hypothetical protein